MATTQWICPRTRPELINDLVTGVDRYNPSNVGILEDYLYHQIRSGEYDCLANLAILKLYQFNPSLYNPDVVINILIKALTSFPMPDFNLCLSLLGEHTVGSNLEEPDPLPKILPSLANLYELLQQCHFTSFWNVFKSSELENVRVNYTVECAGFEDSVREVVLSAVRATFRQISYERLGLYLDLSGSELNDFLEKAGLSLDSARKFVSVPPNSDNQTEAAVVQETIQLPQLIKVIANIP